MFNGTEIEVGAGISLPMVLRWLLNQKEKRERRDEQEVKFCFIPIQLCFVCVSVNHGCFHCYHLVRLFLFCGYDWIRSCKTILLISIGPTEFAYVDIRTACEFRADCSGVIFPALKIVEHKNCS